MGMILVAQLHNRFDELGVLFQTHTCVFQDLPRRLHRRGDDRRVGFHLIRGVLQCEPRLLLLLLLLVCVFCTLQAATLDINTISAYLCAPI